MIDFEPHHLICLSGKNGHGKSALLDALTWALWGQARKMVGTAKADEGLLRLGQSQMMVMLDFMCNGIRYRVRREFSIVHGKPYTQLDFGVLQILSEQIPSEQVSPEQVSPDLIVPVKSLTDKTIRGTQEKINEIVGLDFDACVNTIFLRQGQSNEFSKKSPKDRKEILSSVLGIGHYELIKKRAQEKGRELFLKCEQIAHMRENMLKEIAQKSTVMAQLAQLEEEIQACCNVQTFVQQERIALEHEKNRVVEQEHKQRAMHVQIEQTRTTLTELLQKISGLVYEWRAVRKKQRSLDHMRQCEEEKKNIEQELRVIQEIYAARLVCKEEFLACQEQEQRLRALYEKQHAQEIQEYQRAEHECSTRVATLRERMQLCESSIAQIVKEQRSLNISPSQEPIELLENRYAQRSARYHALNAAVQHMRSEVRDLCKKQELVLEQDQTNCPLCEQNVSHERYVLLQNKYRARASWLAHRIERLEKFLPNYARVLAEQQIYIERFKKFIHYVQAHEQQQLLYAAANREYVAAQRAYDAAQRARVACEQKNILAYADAAYYVIVDKRRALEERGKALEYNPERHAYVTQRVAQLRTILEEYARLVEHIALQQQRKKEIHALCVQAKELKKSLSSLVHITVPLEKFVIEHQKLQRRADELALQLREKEKIKEQCMIQKGSCDQILAMLQQREQSCIEQEQRLAELQVESQEYALIAQALGKDGIQALLIEQVIPELEHEANALLGRLTENQAHLSIESLRDLKSGGTKETLDIKISDNVGIRAYELFSGGEAFRIDFALRIAISKILARRSGRSLQTLIIDEGFGSQDEEGLASMMDAIYKIQDDFAKIIIVSHLVTMKEQFPVQFVVHKGLLGSSVHVVEQG